MKNKTLIVALSELTTLVQSKAFLIGLLLMPVFMGLAAGVQRFTKNVTDIKDRRFVVIDRSGDLYGALSTAAEEWNSASEATGGRARTQPRFLPSRAMFEAGDEAARAELSDRVKRDEIFAFVEIPADALDPDTKSTITYYSNHPGYRPLPSWVKTTINREILNQRFRNASIDRAVVARLTRQVDVSELGLLARDADGGIKAALRVDKVRTTLIPVAMMLIILFSVMSSAPQLLNSVIEEKMSRISEVLIGSITPFELMMGKLLGTAALSVLLAAVYMVGGVFMAWCYGYGDAIRPSDLAWVVVFLSIAVFMFGSIFITIGAACSDLKDAQGMMTPAMLIMMIPGMTWFAILNAPESPLSVGLSLFPTASPFLMLLRIAISPGPPMWQVLLSVVLTGATAVALVHAAGKIFRTGLLMQGKAASLTEMWKWVRAE
jgi:ABC-2 type transport system permease protein